MAELGESGDVQNGREKKRGGVRAKKMSTRIDMTPMVDLGFLLVTFFILTTTIQKPKAITLVMPDPITDPENRNVVPASEAMTLVLGNNDRIFYYFGKEGTDADEPKMEVANYSTIRKILIDRNQFVLDLQQQNSKRLNGVFVFIKPTDNSLYENTVNILDEMKITKIKSYAIVDATTEDLENLPI